MNSEIVVAATDVDLTALVTYTDGTRAEIVIPAGTGWFDLSGRLISFVAALPPSRLGFPYALVPRSKPVELAARFLRDMVIPAADSGRRITSAGRNASTPQEANRQREAAMQQEAMRSRHGWLVRKVQSLADETRVADCVYRSPHGQQIVYPVPLHIEMTPERRFGIMEWMRA